MKKNSNQRVLLYNLIFSFFCVATIHAQQVTKTYTTSLDVPVNSTLEIKNPNALSYEMHATMSSTYEKDKGYILRPGVLGEMPCLIIQDYKVETWDQNNVKQDITIEVIPDKNKPTDAQKLIDQLKIEIPQKSGNHFVIDGNMNLEKMELINGFFRKDRNTFILKDGSKFDVRQLVIKSTLYIPKNSNVLLKTDYVGLKIGDLNGQLSVHASYGYIKAGNIKEVEANIRNFDADFQNVEKLTLNASYSAINAQKIDQLLIGSLALLSQKDKKEGLFDDENDNQALSFSNKYRIQEVKDLKIMATGNDKFNFGKVENFDAINSNFSNFHIKELQNSLTINGKNGDLTVYKIADNFSKISVNNQLSTVELNMEAVPDFKVAIKSTDKTELKLNQSLKEMDQQSGWQASYIKGNQAKGGTVEIDCAYCEIIVN